MSNSAPLLIELGVEELPVSFLHGALDALPGLAEAAFAKARLGHGAVFAYGTPRRVALYVEDLETCQPDLDAWVFGPPARVAFGEGGALTKAALGFAKKQGVDPAQVVKRDTDKGPYAAVRKQEKGLHASALIGELLPSLLASIPFPKVMRWGNETQAFGRPVQWLVVKLGEQTVTGAFAGVTSGETTRGHRFLAPDAVPLRAASDYLDQLRACHVLADVHERSERMTALLGDEAARLGGVLVEDPFLVRECASLVEMPAVVPGSFDETFLALPDQVVISVMRDHQRYFALRGREGSLLPSYLNVVNTAEGRDTIAQGNDRVLRARLEDARFFAEEDGKAPLLSRVPDLDRVTFHRKLGSVGDKVRRLETLVATLVPAKDQDDGVTAARLAKADLVTWMVGEFPELQGEIGAFYAVSQGVPAAVSLAVGEHYLPKGANLDPAEGLPGSSLGSAVALADRMDTLVGIFGIGLEPSGSADPFALRRAAVGILRIGLFGALAEPVDLDALILAAYDSYDAGVLAVKEHVVERVKGFLVGRLPAVFGSTHAPDTLAACLAAWDGRSLPDLHARLSALTAFRTHADFVRLVLAYRRAHNIVEKEAADLQLPFDALRAEPGAEQVLASAFDSARERLAASSASGSYQDAFGTIVRELGPPIDAFFDEVFVMVDDVAVRRNRLALLASIRDEVGRIARLDVLQVEEPGAQRDGNKTPAAAGV